MDAEDRQVICRKKSGLDIDISTWAGITVGADGRVVTLSFKDPGITVLSEKMWKHIGELQALTELDLGDCRSLTALPESIGNLQALTELDLGDCMRLFLNSQPLLRQLKARGVKITGVNMVDDWTAVTSVDLSRLPWSTIPVEVMTRLVNLQALTKLDLTWCSSLTLRSRRFPSPSAASRPSPSDLGQCKSGHIPLFLFFGFNCT